MLRKQTLQSFTRVCKLCGKEFSSTSNTALYCTDTHYRPCPICSKPVEVDMNFVDAVRCCSSECSIQLRKNTSMEIYGVAIPSQSDEVRAKLRSASIDPDVVARRKSTSIAHYGVDNPAKSEEVRKQISDTVRSERCQSRMQATTVERFGSPFATQSAEGLRKYSATCEERYGVPYYCMTEKCRSASGHTISQANIRFSEILQEHSIDHTLEYQIKNRSYDICIPDRKILIEVDPTYTHNAFGNHWGCTLATFIP